MKLVIIILDITLVLILLTSPLILKCDLEARLKLEPYNPPISCSAAVNWKRWPPQLPNFPNGVNIPVKLYPQIDFDFRGNG